MMAILVLMVENNLGRIFFIINNYSIDFRGQRTVSFHRMNHPDIIHSFFFFFLPLLVLFELFLHLDLWTRSVSFLCFNQSFVYVLKIWVVEILHFWFGNKISFNNTRISDYVQKCFKLIMFFRLLFPLIFGSTHILLPVISLPSVIVKLKWG
jgi:hypothetical protein